MLFPPSRFGASSRPASPSPKSTNFIVRSWTFLKSRYPLTLLFYSSASTEGNVALILLEEREGAIGLVPNLVRTSYPIQLIKYDVEKDEVVRGANGLCVRCNFNEVGQLVGLILNSTLQAHPIGRLLCITCLFIAPNNQFVGYTDKNATQKKVLRDVFTKGDSYFVSGDLGKVRNLCTALSAPRLLSNSVVRWTKMAMFTLSIELVILSAGKEKTFPRCMIPRPDAIG